MAKQKPGKAKAPVAHPGAMAKQGRGTGIFVLGMHRSGTSATTGMLGLLGVRLGDKLMAAVAEVNAKGFWEHLDVVALNERLLHWCKSGWQELRPMPMLEPGGLMEQQAIGEATEILRRDFAGKASWAIKDPRLCLFLPVWIKAAEAVPAEPVFIIAIRNPDEVAASLARRDGITRGHAQLLWGRYLVESVRTTEGRRRVISDYARLLADWRSEVDRIARGVGIDWLVSPDAAAAEIQRFLDDNDRHHKAPAARTEFGDALDQCVHEIYHAMLMIADGELDWVAMDGLFERFDVLQAAMAPHVTDLLAHVMMHSDRAAKAEAATARIAMEMQEQPGQAELLRVLPAEVARRTESTFRTASEAYAAQVMQLQEQLRALEQANGALHGSVAEQSAQFADQAAQWQEQLRLSQAAHQQQGREFEQANRALHGVVAEQSAQFAAQAVQWQEQLRLSQEAHQQQTRELEQANSALHGVVAEQSAQFGSQAAQWQEQLRLSQTAHQQLEQANNALRGVVGEQSAQLGGLGAQLALETQARARTEAEFGQAVAGVERQLQLLAAQVAEQTEIRLHLEAEQRRLSFEVVGRDAAIADLSAAKAGADAEIAELANGLAERDAKIATFLQSKSWRITKPLRWSVRILGKLFHG